MVFWIPIIIGAFIAADYISTAMTGKTVIDHTGDLLGFETAADIYEKEGKESTALIVEAFEAVADAINTLNNELQIAFDELADWMETISEQLMYIQIMAAVIIALVVIVGLALYSSQRRTRRMMHSLRRP